MPFRSAAHVTMLLECSERFSEAVPDFRRLLDVVARTIAESTGDACTVRLLSADGQWLEPFAGHHPDPRLAAAIGTVMWQTAHRADSGIWKTVIEQGLTIRLDTSSPRFAESASEAQRAFAQEFKLRSVIGAPLRCRGRVLGGLSLARYGEGAEPYTEDDQALLRHLADRAALALDNAQLLEDERRARVAADLAERRIRRFFDNAPVGLYIVGSDNRYKAVNPAMARIFGYESAHEMEQSIRSISEDAYGEPGRWENLKAQSSAPGVATRSEWSLRHRTGKSLWIAETVWRVDSQDEDLSHFEGIVENLTERRSAEEQLRQAQKMEAVGRLAGGIAHDFNNLLGVIIGYSEIALRRLPEGDPLREKIEGIAAAGERAAVLTRQLLTFSRREVIQPRVFEVNTLIQELDKIVRRLIGEDIKLDLVLDPAAGRVKADPGQVEQVLLNLLANARDAMPTGGAITVETATTSVDAKAASRYGGLSPGRYLLLSVSDTGTGIDPEVQSRMFEPFFTTKPAGQGTGLGLATVYSVVKQAGGHVAVYSEPGHGATFKVLLPTVDEVGAVLPPVAADPVPRGTETVLLSEDDPSLRSLIKELLEDLGYAVLESSSGTEAIEVASRHSGAIALLMTDVVMPGMSGSAAAAVIKRDRPDLRVLFMSGYTDDAVVRHGVVEEGQAFLTKPFTTTDLARKVREAIGDPS